MKKQSGSFLAGVASGVVLVILALILVAAFAAGSLSLPAAKGDPGPENEARFAGLLRQSIDLGVISKRQGQELFSRYFDSEFYVVKAEARSSCSSLRDKDALYAEMRLELADKREGMLEVLADQERFRQAQHYYSDLNMVFDAVNAACLAEI